jgi:hypothetical protein
LRSGWTLRMRRKRQITKGLPFARAPFPLSLFVVSVSRNNRINNKFHLNNIFHHLHSRFSTPCYCFGHCFCGWAKSLIRSLIRWFLRYKIRKSTLRKSLIRRANKRLFFPSPNQWQILRHSTARVVRFKTRFRQKTTVSIVSVIIITNPIVSAHRNYEITRSKTAL